MWSKNRVALSIMPVITGLVMTGPSLAGGPGSENAATRIENTPERQAICEKAVARYKETQPDAKDEGVHVVLLHKYNFCPLDLTIKVGETVRWVNVDKRTSHSVWLKDAGLPESERFFPDEQWEHTFTSPGTYNYLCGPHWDSDDMRGYLTVVE